MESGNAVELVETNKNLSAALDKMEMRCRILEEKLEKSSTFKKMIKNAISLQCLNCNKLISSNIFLNHTTQCNNFTHSFQNTQNSMMNSTMSGSQFVNDASNIQSNSSQASTGLLIAINQTMVKESLDAKPYTEYLIQIELNNFKYSVSRKYKEFYEFHHNLNAQFPTLKFPESAFSILGTFSAPSYLNSSKRPVVIEERRRALQQYLRDLSKIDIIRFSDLFISFIEADKIGQANTNAVVTMNTQATESSEKDSSNDQDQNKTQCDSLMNQTKMSKNLELLDPLKEEKQLNVNIDHRIFTQSPHSFMRKWEDTSSGKDRKSKP